MFCDLSIAAGVVKREVQDMKQVTDLFTSFYEKVKSHTQEWIDKIQSGDLQAQAEKFFEQTKIQSEPLKAEVEKFFAKFTETDKGLAN
ncbi:hypothetical protein PRIEUP_LOCUS1811 [Pristimantis euphronides]